MTIKTSLPLPNDEKELTWTRELAVRLGRPFDSAIKWKVSFCESDVKYIENVIKADTLYRTIYKQGEAKNIVRKNQAEISFLNRFMNDAKCPKHVKNFLYLYMGNKCAEMHTQCENNANSFLAESWARTCH